MNEGCEGGWSMFNGYFAERGHLISESCGPYRSGTNGDSCKHYKSCQPVAKIENSRFLDVSSNQQKISSTSIMKEILLKGPVVGEFKAPNKFKYYDGGILVDEDKPAGSQNV